MKKILLCMLVLALAVALMACGETTTDTTVADDVTDAPVISGDHTHVYEEVVTVAPTCTSLGKKEMKCACGETDGTVYPIPFAMHDAKDATCTADSVCATCGKVLVEKYGHLYVDAVVTAATCTTDGVASSTCHRCGDSTTTVVAASHDYDMNALTVAKGTVSSTCKKCGLKNTFAEGKTILKLDFDGEQEFANFPSYKFTLPSDAKFADGTLRAGGAFTIEYDSSLIASASQVLVSFDFKMMDEGRTNRGESLFSFLATPTGGSTAYNWIVKYYEVDGTFSTADSGHTAANSVKAERGKWYNCTALVNPATKQISVYIDGVSIGTKQLPDQSVAGKFLFRIYDAMPANGTSNPMFDNIKIVEVK